MLFIMTSRRVLVYWPTDIVV